MDKNPNLNQPALPRDLAMPQFHMAQQAIGRVQELKDLHPALLASHLPLVITGIGGLGKTTLAQMYWQRHRDEYNHAAWLSANVLFTAADEKRVDNAEFFVSAFLDHPQLKTNLGLQFDPLQTPFEQFQQMLAVLAALPGQHLLVVDNVPEIAANYLPELSCLQNWRILFTSRDVLPNTTRFRLDTLSPAEAVKLFERIYEKTLSHDEAAETALADILRDIDYHTLTIELLAAYAREKKLALPALFDQLQKEGLSKLDDYEVSTPRFAHQRDIAAHLRTLFWLELAAAEQEILRYCAILPTSNVPLNQELVSEDNLCALFGKQDNEKDFKKLLRRLARLHWLVEKDGGYRCHPVIAETAKAQLKPDAENCAVLLKNVTRLLMPDKKTNESIINRAPFVPLAEAVFKGLWKMDSDFAEEDNAVARLALWIGELFRAFGESFKALDYDQKAITIREKILPEEHSDLAVSYNNLAATYSALGEYQKSLECTLKALDIREKILPKEHLDLTTSYNNLAETYRTLGDYQKSLEYHLKAFAIGEKVLSKEHPHLATSYNNLAGTYDALGEHQKSLEYNLKALAIRENILSKEHPDLAHSYNNLALTYDALGKHQKSLKYNLKALAIFENVLPADHPHLATSYNNIAWAYDALGNPDKAVTFMRQALAILDKALPATHPHIAIVKRNLATFEEKLK